LAVAGGDDDEDGGGSCMVVAVISCPRWFYCDNSKLTCLFLPEAAVAMQDIVPRSDCSGLNPDFVMRGDEGETA